VGFARNGCVALGSWLGAIDDPDPASSELLERALSDPSPVVRGHAVWALGQVGPMEFQEALGALQESEDERWVRDEIGAALDR